MKLFHFVQFAFSYFILQKQPQLNIYTLTWRSRMPTMVIQWLIPLTSILNVTAQDFYFISLSYSIMNHSIGIGHKILLECIENQD